MVIELEASPQPLVQFALCRETAQLPHWDTKLDYGSSTMATRLLAYGIAIREEGTFICGEIGVYEPHRLLRQILLSWDVFRSRRRMRRILRWWPDSREASRIERSIRLLQRRVGQGRLRTGLGTIWETEMPLVTLYSIDGQRTWKRVDPVGEKWPARMKRRLTKEKRIDPADSCLMLSDRQQQTDTADRKTWLQQQLSSVDKDCSIYTPEPPAYSRK